MRMRMNLKEVRGKGRWNDREREGGGQIDRQVKEIKEKYQ